MEGGPSAIAHTFRDAEYEVVVHRECVGDGPGTCGTSVVYLSTRASERHVAALNAVRTLMVFLIMLVGLVLFTRDAEALVSCGAGAVKLLAACVVHW